MQGRKPSIKEVRPLYYATDFFESSMTQTVADHWPLQKSQYRIRS
jgi:hypothetical protein